MNCFNSDKYLRESIDCVINQTLNDWEIIFWDNQSTDKSAEIAKSYGDKRIRYFYAPEHTSLYKGRSAAIKHCTGEYLAFLDCDDLWIPTKLEKQLSILEANKDIVLVHSNTVFFNSDNSYERIYHKRKRMSGYIFKEVICDYHFSLETVMVRMETIVTNELDFGDYNLIGERDFFSMVCFYGDVHYIPETLGKWRIHTNNFTRVLQNSAPKELRRMYLRLKTRFKHDFTREMRLNVYDEIILRKALNGFQVSGSFVRKKLKKLHALNAKGALLWLLSYFPKKLALFVFKIYRDV
tara:strand:+ start:5608 stop:6492 length:885 start_codon:yes stop_codon:yes gene_type:complete